MKKLDREFYDRDSVAVARDLLGKILVRQTDGQRISAEIVETEAYMGVTDKAAHTYGGRRTPRVEVLYGDPGYAYVYLIYGLYSCLNVVANNAGSPQAVLIRAVRPSEGLEYMAQYRYGKAYAGLSEKQITDLTNGPGKLCAAMSVGVKQNGADLRGDDLYIAESEIAKTDFTITASKRIGIDYAGEAKDYLWRFYIEGSKYVSVK